MGIRKSLQLVLPVKSSVENAIPMGILINAVPKMVEFLCHVCK
jgi:hypothetical protein